MINGDNEGLMVQENVRIPFQTARKGAADCCVRGYDGYGY